jgi:membrane-associated protease RseP (regulator of RpoE activity)
MFNGSETATIFVILLIALGIIFWGFNRAKTFGKLGILAWLQSLSLISPWLIFFGLFALGIYLSIAGILLLLVVSIGVYIWLGKRLRDEGQEVLLQKQTTENITENPVIETPEIINPNGEKKPEILPIPEADLAIIKTIFGIDTFFSTDSISYQEGAIFRGNLRGEPDLVYAKLSEKLTEKLGEKYRLFLVETPEGKPVVIILPSSNDPQPMNLGQKNLAIALFVATIFTSVEAVSLLLGFDLFQSWGRYGEAIPISLGLWAILAVHEIAHYVMAKRHNIKLSWPFLIPSWQIGAFGAITQFTSLIPNRNILFDIAFAGPAAGGLLSLIFLCLGLSLSHPGSLFEIPNTFFQGSILVGTLARIFLGSSLQQSLVDVHPLTVIGWLGLVITSLNLLPAGQLDGGRIIQAIYGRKLARRVTIITLVVLGIVSLINPANSIPLYWAIIILFLQRDLERPSLNELTEPDDTRAGWGLFILFLMMSVLIPLSPSLAGQLGIGG